MEISRFTYANPYFRVNAREIKVEIRLGLLAILEEYARRARFKAEN